MEALLRSDINIIVIGGTPESRRKLIIDNLEHIPNYCPLITLFGKFNEEVKNKQPHRDVIKCASVTDIKLYGELRDPSVYVSEDETVDMIVKLIISSNISNDTFVVATSAEKEELLERDLSTYLETVLVTIDDSGTIIERENLTVPES